MYNSNKNHKKPVENRLLKEVDFKESMALETGMKRKYVPPLSDLSDHIHLDDEFEIDLPKRFIRPISNPQGDLPEIAKSPIEAYKKQLALVNQLGYYKRFSDKQGNIFCYLKPFSLEPCSPSPSNSCIITNPRIVSLLSSNHMRSNLRINPLKSHKYKVRPGSAAGTPLFGAWGSRLTSGQ